MPRGITVRRRCAHEAAARSAPVSYPRVHIFQEDDKTVIDFMLRSEYTPGDEQVLRDYVRDVGTAINVSVLDRRTLRDKLDNPWLYPELEIRVGGRGVAGRAEEGGDE